MNSDAQANLFLTRWLATAQKQRRFPREIATDIEWLLKKGSVWISKSMVTPVFATLIFDDIIGLLKSIRRLDRATMSSAPDEPQKNYTASDEPFRYTGSSTGRSAVCIIDDQYSQNQISGCLNDLLL